MDTEVDDTKKLPGPLAATDVKTRRSGKIDLTTGVVTIDGAAYARNDLPANAQVWCGLHGMRRHLLNAKNPADAWADLVAGKLPSDGAAKPRELDNRRLACAMAHADARRRAENVKAGTPQAAAILDECKQAAAAADKKVIAEMLRFNGSAASHYAKLEGKDTPLLAEIGRRADAAA